MFNLLRNHPLRLNTQKEYILVCLFTSFWSFSAILAQNSVELYEDTETGQIFTKLGKNRIKIDKVPSSIEKKSDKKSDSFTVLPDAFTHRPDDLSKEKLTIAGRIQYRGASGSANSPLYQRTSRF